MPKLVYLAAGILSVLLMFACAYASDRSYSKDAGDGRWLAGLVGAVAMLLLAIVCTWLWLR